MIIPFSELGTLLVWCRKLLVHGAADWLCRR